MRQRGIVMDNSQRFQTGDALAIDLGVTLLILAFKTFDPLIRRLQGVMRGGEGEPGEDRLLLRRRFNPAIHLAGVSFAGVKIIRQGDALAIAGIVSVERLDGSERNRIVKVAGAAAHKGEGVVKTAVLRRGAGNKTEMPFAGHQRVIAGIFKALGHGGDAVGQPKLITLFANGAVVPPHAAHPGLLVTVAGQQHRTRRGRHRRGVILAHADTLLRHGLQVGGGDLTAEGANIGITHIIGDNHDDVWMLILCAVRAAGEDHADRRGHGFFVHD